MRWAADSVLRCLPEQPQVQNSLAARCNVAALIVSGWVGGKDPGRTRYASVTLRNPHTLASHARCEHQLSTAISKPMPSQPVSLLSTQPPLTPAHSITLMEMRLVSRIRPSPPHLSHGVKISPRPSHRGHVDTCSRIELIPEQRWGGELHVGDTTHTGFIAWPHAFQFVCAAMLKVTLRRYVACSRAQHRGHTSVSLPAASLK
jgi:hypothetical protein